jgi:hypothetical protein
VRLVGVFSRRARTPEDHDQVTGRSPITARVTVLTLSTHYHSCGEPITTAVVKVFSSSENSRWNRSLELLHVDRSGEST